MEAVESPLEVLSRAATMVQNGKCLNSSDSDNADLNNSTSSSGDSEVDRTASPTSEVDRNGAKELPSTRWRRDRRSARMPDYRPKEQSSRALRSHSFNDRKSNATLNVHVGVTNSSAHSDSDSPERSVATVSQNGKGSAGEIAAPLDMRVPRASVITKPPTNSVSMCDPVIDEHFRRSLGQNYDALFGKKAETHKPNTKDRGSSPIVFQQDPCKEFLASKEENPKSTKCKVETPQADMEVETSVDDHFAKALGDTWKKIQKTMDKSEEKTTKIITRSGVVI